MKHRLLLLFALLLPALLFCGCSAGDYSTRLPEDTFVTYEAFGAVGDGVTDDFPAILAAHTYANEKDLPVFGKNDATYYVGTITETVKVLTSVNWGSAKFIIDDRNAANNAFALFLVSSRLPSEALALNALPQDAKSLGMTLPFDSLVIVTDKNTQRYFRSGRNGVGSAQSDAIIVAKDGTIDPNTPLNWDYSAVTSAVAYPIPEDTLTVSGGNFTNLCPATPPNTYIQPVILVRRSNTVVENITSELVEQDLGAAYDAFLSIENCANVTVRDLQLAAHKVADAVKADGGILNSSYSLNHSLSANLTFRNVIQTNDITNAGCWGIIGSNQSKNVLYDGCRLNRIDSHRGATNLTVKGCELGCHGLTLTGFGNLLIEDTRMENSAFLRFRSDYGSFWNGDVTIRNCTWVPTDTWGICYMIHGDNKEDWDFGYTTHLCHTLTIDNLKVESPEGEAVSSFSIFMDYFSYYDQLSYDLFQSRLVAPFIMPERVTVRNITFSSPAGSEGVPVEICRNTYPFSLYGTELDIDGKITKFTLN